MNNTRSPGSTNIHCTPTMDGQSITRQMRRGTSPLGLRPGLALRPGQHAAAGSSPAPGMLWNQNG
eukprot:1725471-Lingulodinium_polyedra.AAC.1